MNNNTSMTREDVITLVSDTRNQGRVPDLSGMDLSGLDLHGLDLRWASLNGANLRWASLNGANLRWASLNGANLSGANLCEADLRWASLYKADLREADLHEAHLLKANLCGANLSGANLCEADLRWAKLRLANLSGVKLQLANLSGAHLFSANLGETVWCGLHISGLPSHETTLVPTPTGWKLNIGCWRDRFIDELKKLIDSDENWPEAEGEEIEARRPHLRALLAMCEAHIAYHDDVIAELAEKWAQSKPLESRYTKDTSSVTHMRG